MRIHYSGTESNGMYVGESCRVRRNPIRRRVVYIVKSKQANWEPRAESREPRTEKRSENEREPKQSSRKLKPHRRQWAKGPKPEYRIVLSLSLMLTMSLSVPVSMAMALTRVGRVVARSPGSRTRGHGMRELGIGTNDQHLLVSSQTTHTQMY